MSLWFIIAVRVLANPCSNALQKLLALRGVHPVAVIGLAHLGLTLLAVVALPFCDAPRGSAFWLNITVSAALATLANVLIVYAVRDSDLSLLGPVNSFKPVVSLLPGWLLLGEVPSLATLAGIALVVGGSCWLAAPVKAGQRAKSPLSILLDHGVQLRIAALIPSAVEAVFLKRALGQASPATTFFWWAGLCFAASLVGLLFVGARFRRRDWERPHLLPLGGLVVTTGLMQFCTLVALRDLHVGAALALFQLSSVVSVVLGRSLFQEAHFRRRLLASLVMAGGAAAIVAGR